MNPVRAGTASSAWPALAVLAAAAWWGGCNAPPVSRQDETARFQAEMRRRAASMAMPADRPLTIEDCERLALAGSLDLRLRRLALEMQDDQVRLAMTGALPKLSLAYDHVERSNDALVSFGQMTASFEDRRQQRLVVQGTIPLLDWGITYYAWRNAVDRRAQERLLYERAVQLLRRDVRVAHAQHAGAVRQERLARVALRAAEQVLRVAKNLEREAMAVPAETALVEAALAQAAMEVSLAEARVRETHLRLAQLMSLPPGADFVIHPELPPMPPLPSAGELRQYVENALVKRPELAAQDLQRHMALNTVRQAAADFLPRVDGLGSFNWSSASVAVNPSYFLTGFRVAHSLLSGGGTLWQYSLAKKAATAEEQRTLLVSLGVVYEVEMRALRLRQAHDIIGAARALEEARRRALDRIINLYREGLEDEAGAARALAELTTQATVLDRVQTDYLTAWYELEAAAMLLDSPPQTMPTTREASEP